MKVRRGERESGRNSVVNNKIFKNNIQPATCNPSSLKLWRAEAAGTPGQCAFRPTTVMVCPQAGSISESASGV